uniref:Uncharacterized protein n=1 Tax=viral metagenome TaxID=1070528 RepID=A0A6M3LZF2_9ZZZZ
MPTPTTVGPSDVALDGIQASVQRTYQRKAFFALGRHWVFYVNDAGFLVYDSSLGNSETWYGPTVFENQDDGSEFTVFLQETAPTAYVHLVRASSTGSTPIYYHRGTLAADGTISWDAEDEAAPFDLGWEYENLGICMGYDGYIYIVYTKVDAGDPNVCTPYVCQSTTNDGSWTTGTGYPLQITAVEDASWIPLVSPYGTEVIVVYTTAGGDILSRLLSGGAWGVPVDSGFDIGQDAQKISITSERVKSGATWSARAAYVAFQAADWDLYCIRYESDAWQAAPANVIEVIGAFREANPMLSILDTGDEDPTVDDHPPATLYCFWTPTADAPTAEKVTYRVSRDLGDTWTNEAGADAAVEWIDETLDGFEVQASGSAYLFSSSDYDNARSYIGIVYMVHRMPPALRHAALGFEDPSEDLPGEFIVRQRGSADLGAGFDGQASVDLAASFSAQAGPRNLPGEFIVRHTAALNLKGEFFVTNAASSNLLGELVVRHIGTPLNLHGAFVVNQGSVDLYAEFEVNQSSEDLYGEYIVRHEQDENLKAVFLVIDLGDLDLKGQFFVRNAGSVNLKGEFIVSHAASEDLLAYFNVTQAVNLRGIFDVRQPGATNLRGIFDVRQPGSADLKAGFRIDKDFISKGLNVSVYRDLGVIG